jgi:hypothetical protein
MQYLRVIYLLPEDSQKWGFSLYDLFMNSVPAKIRKGILASTSYVRPDFRMLVTGQDHNNLLVKLKNEAEKVNKALSEQDDRLRETCSELVGGNRSSSQNRASTHCTTSDDIDSQAFNDLPVNTFTNHISAAEETIARATGNAGPKHDRDTVYPVDPKTNKVSDFPIGFFGCYNCGDSTYQFSKCPKGDASSKARLYYNYGAHEKNTKAARLKRESAKTEGSHYGRAAAAPSYYGNPVCRHQEEFQVSTVNHEVATPPAEDDTGPNYAVYAHIVKVFHGSTTAATRPMPVAVLNHLSTINMTLGTGPSINHQAVRINVLFDTCAAIITGYKPYHDCIKRKHPEVVHDYEEFDSANPFEPIKLSGSLRDPGDISKEIVGTLNAVIRYKTPFWNTKGMSVPLCFALGNTVSCNTIMGLHAIKGMEMLWNIKKGEVILERLKAPRNWFVVAMRETEYGLLKTDCERHSDHVPASPATSRTP